MLQDTLRRTVTPSQIPAARERVGREESNNHRKHNVVGYNGTNHQNDRPSPVRNNCNKHREHKNDNYNPDCKCISPVWALEIYPRQKKKNKKQNKTKKITRILTCRNTLGFSRKLFRTT
jgi:hypothetical protein